MTHAANVWTSADPIGQRWRRVAELHGLVGIAHLIRGEPMPSLVQFVDGLTGPLAPLLPAAVRQACDDVLLIEQDQLSPAAADLLMENLAPSLAPHDVAGWSIPQLGAEKVQGWLYGQLLDTGSEDGYRRARETVIGNAAGVMHVVLDAIKAAGLPRDGLVEQIPAWAWVFHEGERYWFGCPVCRYPMKAQLGRVTCLYPPHDKAIGGPVTVRTPKRRPPNVGAWNQQRVADLGGIGVIQAATVEGHVCLVRPAWRYSVIPGCEEIRLYKLLTAMPDVSVTLWPYTDRYDLHVEAGGRRAPWRVDVKDYADPARLVTELLKKDAVRDTSVVIVVPDYRSSQVGVLNERLRQQLGTRRTVAMTSAVFLKTVAKAVGA
ncbi:hypothetical protein AB0K00_21810 [Dactylosporangium sp. NPDC049525]|uniref:restriction endonuclease-related protein n=1 Tax=Dactylosporangium sp. NPDC049525 TaxID=3154730 RepID=UPI00341CD684